MKRAPAIRTRLTQTQACLTYAEATPALVILTLAILDWKPHSTSPGARSLEHCQRSNLRAEPASTRETLTASTRETLTAPGDARDLQSKATCPCAFLYAFLAILARALLQRCVDTCAARAWWYTISSAVKVTPKLTKYYTFIYVRSRKIL